MAKVIHVDFGNHGHRAGNSSGGRDSDPPTLMRHDDERQPYSVRLVNRWFTSHAVSTELQQKFWKEFTPAGRLAVRHLVDTVVSVFENHFEELDFSKLSIIVMYARERYSDCASPGVALRTFMRMQSPVLEKHFDTRRAKKKAQSKLDWDMVELRELWRFKAMGMVGEYRISDSERDHVLCLVSDIVMSQLALWRDSGTRGPSTNTSG